MTRIAVYGAGGVGGYFGARLAQAGAEVHFLARGAHLQALREHGLRVRSVKGDFQVRVQATDDPADIGPIRTVDVAWTAFNRLVAEVCAVAEADGSPVPQAAQDSAVALAQAIEPGSFSSLHDDLVAGRRMELEALHGFVVRRAAQHALAVPMSEAVYAILKPWAVRNQRARI